MTNYSIITSVLGGYARQNLRFTIADSKPSNSTPIYVKLNNGSLLLGDLAIQKSNGGISTLVGTEYKSGSFLILFGSSGIVGIPAEGLTYDGVRVNLSGVAASASIYCAFFIKSPTANNINICSGSRATIIVSNYQEGYIYKLYEGSSLLGRYNASEFSTPTLTATTKIIKNYQLEAIEIVGTDSFISGRTTIQVTVHPNPLPPNNVTLY